MKLPMIGLLGAALLMGACKHRQKPPQTTQPVQVTRQALPAGFIGQCGHADARDAAQRFPAGWQSRLNRTVPKPGPATVTDELLGGVELPPKVVEARRAQPIQRPTPSFPQAAISAQLEGECQVLFDVDIAGKVMNPLVACTRQEFVDEARRAVQGVSFRPRREDGRDVIQWNVIYPMQFCLSDPRVSG